VFSINVPISKAWDFLSDMEKVASCTPNVEAIRLLGNGRAEWTLKVKLGPVSKRMKLLTETLKSEPPSHAKFKAEGENITMQGTINLREVSEGVTEVRYNMKAEASGSLAGILNNVIKSRLKSEVEGFERKVKEKLEGG